jgi:hypothetical protein
MEAIYATRRYAISVTDEEIQNDIELVSKLHCEIRVRKLRSRSN